MGKDTNVLAKQVEERLRRDQLDTERHELYATAMLEHQDIVGSHFAERDLKDRQTRLEMNKFRQSQIDERKRQEDELRALDEEAQRVPTSFLDFAGQDAQYDSRVRMQKEQQKDWLSQQLESIAQRRAREQQEAAHYDAVQARIGQMQQNQQDEADRNAKELRLRNAEYNHMLAADKRQYSANLRHTQKLQEEQELQIATQGQFLNEQVVGGRENFKGFSVEQRQRILDEQQYQIAELNDRRRREREEKEQYEDTQEDMRKAIVRADRERARTLRQNRLELSQTHSMQATQKLQRYAYLDNVVYQPEVREEFFEQFGKSCR